MREKRGGRRTGEHVGSVDLATRTGDVDARGNSCAHRHHVGEEDERGHLQSHLLADVPQFTRTRHRADHELKSREVSQREEGEEGEEGTNLFEDVVGYHLR